MRASSSNRLHLIKKRQEFLRFFDGSEVFRFSSCIIFRVPNTFGHYRLGITFKAKGRAVHRNNVRRKLKGLFIEINQCLGSFDYNVVIPYTKGLQHPYPEKLRHELVSFFIKRGQYG